MHELQDLKIPKYMGHRGAASLMTENTLASFRKAKELGCCGSELDVQVCASGELVVFHDYDLNRLTGVNLTITDTMYDELKKYKLNAPQMVLDNNGGKNPCPDEIIPTLDMVLDLVGQDFFLDIELKSNNRNNYARLAKAVENCLKRHNHYQAMVSSFNPLLIVEYKRIGVHATSVIYSDDDSSPWFLRRGAGMLVAGADIGKPDYLNILSGKYRKRDKCIITWTVDDADTANKMFELGVRSVITNRIQDFL